MDSCRRRSRFRDFLLAPLRVAEDIGVVTEMSPRQTLVVAASPKALRLSDRADLKLLEGSIFECYRLLPDRQGKDREKSTGRSRNVGQIKGLRA